MTKEEVLQYIKTQTLAVVSTATPTGKPQAAVVEFGELDDLTIIIDTLATSRKYQNLQSNQQVAIVIGWDQNITVQMDAIATELAGDELAKCKEAYFAKNKRARRWEEYDDIAYFAFKPTWVRYSDVGQSPWVIEEFDIAT